MHRQFQHVALASDVAATSGAPDTGLDFCRDLPYRCGVVAVPDEVFYARPEHGRHLVRFACCKQLDVIDAAAERLRGAFAAEVPA